MTSGVVSEYTFGLGNDNQAVVTWQNLEPHHLAFLQVQRTQRAQPGVPTKGSGHYPA